MHYRALLPLVFVLPFTIVCLAATPEPSPTSWKPRDTDTRRTFPEISSKAEWQKRAAEIRQNVLASCGLWPMPQKTPLRAEIFGRVERDGYSVEKVHLQTLDGFYLAGNLYRPLGRTDGPFPGILNPHGHWNNGRMADTDTGSIAARCIQFARFGAVAFSYDMVGYVDTVQVNHKFASNPTNQLWGISLMGLQTWNSIRALDFLASLPDVDKARLASTGESGGGTQTFMLGAIDDRLAALAPIVMVSHSMQGGCLCENAPLLRVEYSNMEIAAVPAPKPQILVGASGDWTRDIMNVEGPAIANIYRLFNAEHAFHFTRFDFPHNYNKTSREAVYEFFGKTLFNHSRPYTLKEKPYQKEPDADLRVFPDGKLPENALTEAQLIQFLISRTEGFWKSHFPKDQKSAVAYRNIYRPLWLHSFQLQPSLPPAPQPQLEKDRVVMPNSGSEPAVIARVAGPDKSGKVVVLIGDVKTNLSGLLVRRGMKVISLSLPEDRPYQLGAAYYTTYNRTRSQLALQRIKQVIDAVRAEHPKAKVILCGQGRAGLTALLAAPLADAVSADADQFDASDASALMAKDLFVPNLKSLGAFEGIAVLAAPHPLLCFNTGDRFSTDLIRRGYKAAGRSKAVTVHPAPLSDEEISKWVQRLDF